MTKTALPPGTTINDRYELSRKLGSDGDVYEAHDRYLDKKVALKLLRPDGGRPQSWDEAKRLEQLRSRFIVPVLNADVVTNSDLRFITTPLLPHGDLEADARPVGLSVLTAVRFGHQLSAGVDAIHAAGMVHRDIKPANGLRDEDRILVSDVAFCSILDPNGEAPRQGSWCTLAPETAPDDGRCSIRSDVYSLAATVFYLLSGEYPVDHRLPRAEQQKLIASGALRNISAVAPHVPRTVATVVRRGMNADPDARYASAADFGNALVTAVRRRRDWRRTVHAGHVYCAASPASSGRKAISVCSEEATRGTITMRAFHPTTGRAVAGVPENTTRTSRSSTALRTYFALLA
ncbi:serine/threonine-protein kinase [Gryllotalpicola koreensis]|uniref:non-specific serine/threonine protein kinase n=1 Tax=Gryllotalpicola koreensis TaxID=993086 RepID=A0ABP7ZQL3_9MICO